MPGQFRPADHSKGDANTIGGYMAVHDRPAAFEGSDGFSYSVEILVEREDTDREPWAAFFLFVKWARIGAQSPEGHLESDYLARGLTEAEARERIGAMSLNDVKSALDSLIAVRSGSTRRWFDAMRDDSDELWKNKAASS
jgi:hypothetical protein